MWLALFLGVKIIFTIPQQCLDSFGTRVVGCYIHGEKTVYVKPGLNLRATERVTFHELAHYLGIDSEREAEDFAKSYTGGAQVGYYEYYPEELKYVYINLSE